MTRAKPATTDKFRVTPGGPIPPNGRSPKYPWANMKVGDSFTVEIAKRKSVQIAGTDYGRRHGKRFTTRTMPEGVKVWRTE